MHHQVNLCPLSPKFNAALIDCSGIGSQMWVVILGRVISGMGGGGCMTISSVIITGKEYLEFPKLKLN